jgi:hypothetical protein
MKAPSDSQFETALRELDEEIAKYE